MRHVKYFLTGLLQFVIAIGIFGVAVGILTWLSGTVATVLGTTTLEVISGIIMTGFLIVLLIVLVAFIYLMGKDYWRQRHLNQIQKDYEELWKENARRHGRE